MKIIHLISGNLGQGGAERFVMDLASAQAELGHDVTICCFRQYDNNSLDISANVHVLSLKKEKGFSFSFAFKILSFLKKENPNVVNCHLPAVFNYLIPSLLSLKNINYYYTIHSAADKEEPRKWIRKLRRYFILKKRLTIIAITPSIQDDFIKLYNVSNSSVVMIYNGRKKLSKTSHFESTKKEIEEYKIDTKTFVFIAVGRLYNVKNFPLMINAMKKLLDKNCILIILGAGDTHQFDDIKPSNVILLGPKSNVSDYLLCSNAFCCSSIWEGFPISIIEAMSVGLPIISTPVGGIPDVVIDGENGFLCQNVSLEEYHSVLQKFLSLQDSQKKVISQKNIDDFNLKYNILNTAEQYIEVYSNNLR